MNHLGKQLSKTQKAQKKAEKDNNDGKVIEQKTHKYFIPHARLNRGQRRYCHCIMKARVSKPTGEHYGFCQGIARADWAKAKTMRNKLSARQYYFNIARTNCVMNYDYNDYSLREVQAFASEKGLPLYELDVTGKKKYYPKDRLVQLLTTNYIKKHAVRNRIANHANVTGARSTVPSKKNKRLFMSPMQKKTKKAKLKQ